MLAFAVASILSVLYEEGRRFIPINFLMATLLWAMPDMDTKMGLKHRHWLTHSPIIPLIFVAYAPNLAFLLVVWGMHLLVDLGIEKGKQRTGTWCIHIFKRVLPTKASAAWLVCSAAIGFVVSIYVGGVMA
jgi:hypothetical protein